MNSNTSVDSTVASAAQVGSAGGSAASIYGWLMSNEMLALVGALTAVCGLITSFIFQLRRDRREAKLHQAQMANFELKVDP